MSEPSRSDDQLLARLAAALEAADPVPDAVMAAARASFTWFTVDAELAALVFDSATEQPVGVRATETARQMTFRTPAMEIELVILTDATRRLVGQLVPPRTAGIELHHERGPMRVQADASGRFAFDEVPAGSIRLICRFEGDERGVVTTEWVLI
jgi:hypothetical protein